LTPLLAPRSVAVVGASAREGRPGFQVLQALHQADPSLAVHPITPRYEAILGFTCRPEIGDVPPVDLAILAGAAQRIDKDLEAAIAAGARSAIVFGARHDERAPWLERIAARASEAGLPLLGPDSLGYVNFESGVAATWARPHVPKGGVALISQSGTVYWEANTNDPRIGFSLTAHSGLEAVVTIADLIEYALELERTRVIGIYVETVRDANGFAGALAEAAARDIPVVALSAGRTARSRAQMTTHAGRLAGDGAALEGLFRRHGVARTVTPDEWWSTIALLAAERPLAAGGIAAVMDSGGGLAMFLDYTEELRIPVARFGEETSAELAELLGTDAVPSGAIDFWAGEADRHGSTETLLGRLMQDPDTAAVVAFTTYGEAPAAGFASHTAAACVAAAARTDKPVIAATYTSRQLHPELLTYLSSEGIPTLDGMRNALLALRHALDRRDFTRDLAAGAEDTTPLIDPERVACWRRRLAGTVTLTEAEALEFLAEFGVPVVETRRAIDKEGAVAAATAVGFPVVLKTDEGLTHKLSHGGVRLDLRDAVAVRVAYSELAAALGPRVLIAPMLDGIEIALGVVVGQFGATLMISAGGGMIELLTDRCHLLGPASASAVERAMADLHVTRVIHERFGDSSQISAFHQLAARVSALGAAFVGIVAELDINPVIIGKDGCLAVDALLATANDGGAADGS
jgi:acyl-CoA synthetase (NDP forming)